MDLCNEWELLPLLWVEYWLSLFAREKRISKLLKIFFDHSNSLVLVNLNIRSTVVSTPKANAIRFPF